MSTAVHEKRDVYGIVTEKIIEALDAGTVPWRKPWANLGEGGHKNLESKRPYTGVNQLLLQISEYEQPWWITFNGAKRLGGHIAKGERSTLVVFAKQARVKDRDADDPEERKSVYLLRYYRIWNVEQTVGLEDRVPMAPASALDIKWDPVALAEDLRKQYPQPSPAVKHGGDEAFYSPTSDVVGLPTLKQFPTAANYYSTLFHELTHSTGHPTRLARDLSQMGSESYSREELVAEIGAAFLCALVGIEPLYETSAAYVDHWRERLGDEPRLIVAAAGAAQRAADYIQGIAPKEDDDA